MHRLTMTLRRLHNAPSAIFSIHHCGFVYCERLRIHARLIKWSEAAAWKPFACVHVNRALLLFVHHCSLWKHLAADKNRNKENRWQGEPHKANCDRKQCIELLITTRWTFGQEKLSTKNKVWAQQKATNRFLIKFVLWIFRTAEIIKKNVQQHQAKTANDLHSPAYTFLSLARARFNVFRAQTEAHTKGNFSFIISKWMEKYLNCNCDFFSSSVCAHEASGAERVERWTCTNCARRAITVFECSRETARGKRRELCASCDPMRTERAVAIRPNKVKVHVNNV